LRRLERGRTTESAAGIGDGHEIGGTGAGGSAPLKAADKDPTAEARGLEKLGVAPTSTEPGDLSFSGDSMTLEDIE
jgi:hypothetical protein